MKEAGLEGTGSCAVCGRLAVRGGVCVFCREWGEDFVRDQKKRSWRYSLALAFYKALKRRARMERNAGRLWAASSPELKECYGLVQRAFSPEREGGLGGKCFYCGRGLVLDGVGEEAKALAPVLDHFVPVSAGGGNDAGNLVVSCNQCNTVKGSVSGQVFSDALRAMDAFTPGKSLSEAFLREAFFGAEERARAAGEPCFVTLMPFPWNAPQAALAGRGGVDALSLEGVRGGAPEMEYEVKEPLRIEDGKHTGTIARVVEKNTPQGYTYVDVFIKVDGVDGEVKYGCPANVSSATKLGRLLAEFVELVPGSKVDPEKVLTGKRVSFLTVTERLQDGREFARVVDYSVKPLKEGGGAGEAAEDGAGGGEASSPSPAPSLRAGLGGD